MPKPEDFTLVVLAGGEGSRMGGPKALLRLGGRPILEWLVDRFHWRGPTLLVTAPGRERPPGAARFDAEAVDPVAGVGPLRGVLTALENCQTPLLLVTTVDMPGVDRRGLCWLALQLWTRRRDALGLFPAREVDGARRIEPFPCALARGAETVVRQRIDGGRRAVHSLASEAGFFTLPHPEWWSANVWTNLNEPADVARFEATMTEVGSDDVG